MCAHRQSRLPCLVASVRSGCDVDVGGGCRGQGVAAGEGWGMILCTLNLKDASVHVMNQACCCVRACVLADACRRAGCNGLWGVCQWLCACVLQWCLACGIWVLGMLGMLCGQHVWAGVWSCVRGCLIIKKIDTKKFVLHGDLGIQGLRPAYIYLCQWDLCGDLFAVSADW